MTTALKNHPGMWLRDDAANAFNAMEDRHGVIVVNRAGVTEAEQQDVIDQWDRGDRAGLYPPARPAYTSLHVKDGGTAVDVYNFTDDRSKLNEFGFQWYGSTDPVHYFFTGWGGNAPTNNVDAGGAVAGVHGPNPFGIPFTGGLQKVARLYGYTGALDQNFGPGSLGGFAEFLRRNWGYVGNNELGPVMWTAIQRWLKARYGYEGALDGIPGPQTRGALNRADTKNWAEL
jgi:hypothetical protein